MHLKEASWQRHLGEFRVQVGPQYRFRGLGKILAAEIFAIARDMGLRKIVAHMTPDLAGRHCYRQTLRLRARSAAA
jgi:GNAT superfamily N-acetyltransferase